MRRLFERLCVLAALACLVAMQVHVSREMGPDVWSVPGQPGHSVPGHACAACFAGTWATPSAPPSFHLALWTARLELETPKVLHKPPVAEESSPRAPPLV